MGWIAPNFHTTVYTSFEFYYSLIMGVLSRKIHQQFLIQCVEVFRKGHHVEKETYYATLFLSKGDETLEIDARPSDAIAVAMRAEAPIYVTANVLMNGSVSTDSAKDEEEAQEFKDFIQSIKPSDFEKLMKGRHEESDQQG